MLASGLDSAIGRRKGRWIPPPPQGRTAPNTGKGRRGWEGAIDQGWAAGKAASAPTRAPCFCGSEEACHGEIPAPPGASRVDGLAGFIVPVWVGVSTGASPPRSCTHNVPREGSGPSAPINLECAWLPCLAAKRGCLSDPHGVGGARRCSQGMSVEGRCGYTHPGCSGCDSRWGGEKPPSPRAAWTASLGSQSQDKAWAPSGGNGFSGRPEAAAAAAAALSPADAEPEGPFVLPLGKQSRDLTGQVRVYPLGNSAPSFQASASLGGQLVSGLYPSDAGRRLPPYRWNPYIWCCPG